MTPSARTHSVRICTATVVLPVPGGPCTSVSRRVSAASTAARCESLRVACERRARALTRASSAARPVGVVAIRTSSALSCAPAGRGVDASWTCRGRVRASLPLSRRALSPAHACEERAHQRGDHGTALAEERRRVQLPLVRDERDLRRLMTRRGAGGPGGAALSAGHHCNGRSGHLNGTFGGKDMGSMAQTGLLLVPSDALGHTWALPGALGAGQGLPPKQARERG